MTQSISPYAELVADRYALLMKIEELRKDSARYQWLLKQAWFQFAFDRFEPDDHGRQDLFEICASQIIDAAMKNEDL